MRFYVYLLKCGNNTVTEQLTTTAGISQGNYGWQSRVLTDGHKRCQSVYTSPLLYSKMMLVQDIAYVTVSRSKHTAENLDK